MKVIKYLEDRAKDVSGEMLKHVATISSNNDEEIGDIISSAFNASGKGGVVTMEISRDEKTSFEVINGATLDKTTKKLSLCYRQGHWGVYTEQPISSYCGEQDREH